MIFDKDRIAKLSGLKAAGTGLMTEGKKGIDDAMADQFGGGKEDGDPWLDGEVTTEGAEEEGNMMHKDEAKKDEKLSDEAKAHKDEETAVREMIRAELRHAKKEMDEERAVRETVRREIKSVLKSRGVTMGGTGFGFKR